MPAMPYATPESWNLRLVGHTDLNGHGDTMQLMVRGNYLYCGHTHSMGTSIVDVSDPRKPRVVNQIPNPPGVRSAKVQLAEDLMLVNHEEWGGKAARTGLAIYQIRDPKEPVPLGFFQTTGRGPHRMWFVDGRNAYSSVTPEGYTHRIMFILDMRDPANPRELSKWWIPGQWTAGGEQPTWPPDLNYNIHHGIAHGDRLYMGMWDAGFGILDISNKEAPALVGRLEWSQEGGRSAHTALPLPHRKLVVLCEESNNNDCQELPRRVRVIDIQDEHNPRILSLFPQPEGDFCKKGLRFGPHNLHENQPGSTVSDRFIYVTYYNAGLRVVDIDDPRAPKEVAYYIPGTPPGQKAIQTNDVYVDHRGLIYISDRVGAGIDILEWT